LDGGISFVENKVKNQKKSKLKSAKGHKTKTKYNSKLPSLKLCSSEPLSSVRVTRSPYLSESFEKSIYASKESFTDDTLSNRTLKLRIQGQLRTIRALEAQLNDTSNALQMKDSELLEMKRKLSAMDRRDKYSMHREDHKQVSLKTDYDSVTKLKVSF